MQAREQRLRDLSRALPRAEALLATPAQRFDRVSDRFAGSLRALAQRKALDLNRAAGGLRPGLLRHRLEQRVDRLTASAGRLAPALGAGLARKSDRLAALRLPQGQMLRDLSRAAERVATRAQRMKPALMADLTRRRDRLAALNRMHESLGYEQTLARGYAVVRDADGTPMTDAAAVRGLAQFTVQMRDGRLDAVPVGSAPRPRKKPDGTGPDQGSLF